MFKFRSWCRINCRPAPLTPGAGARQDGSPFGCHQTNLFLIDVRDHVHQGVDGVCSVLAKQLELLVDKLLPKTVVGQDECRHGLVPPWVSGRARPGPSQGSRAEGGRALEQKRRLCTAEGGPASSLDRGCPQQWGPGSRRGTRWVHRPQAPAATGCPGIRCSLPPPRR